MAHKRKVGKKAHSRRRSREQSSPDAVVARPQSLKRKKRLGLIALLGAPVMVSGYAQGIGQQAILSAADALSSAVQHVLSNQNGNVNIVGIGGGGYYLGEQWRTLGELTVSQEEAAVALASDVVNLAMRRANVSHVSPAFKRRLIQWILADNLSPSEASTIVASDSAGDSNGFQKLVAMVLDHPQEWRDPRFDTLEQKPNGFSIGRPASMHSIAAPEVVDLYTGT